ncbi:MAG: tetratricopeptide repeat protein [Saprospiraceae bacterium]
MNSVQQHDLTHGTAHLVHNAIGRSEEIKQMHAQLYQSTRPLVVTGVGGLGKTTFTQMYWQRHRAEYNYAAWISTSALYTADSTRRTDNAEYFIRAFLDNTALKTSLQLTFNPLQKPVDQFRQQVAALANLGEGRHLLVIDNAPEAAAVYLPELSTLTHWSILLTSRDAIPNMAKFELDTLPPDLAAELFERVYEAPARSETLNSLLDDIGYHTLTIELLAAYAREKHLDLLGLLALLRQKGLMQLDDYEVSVPRYHQSRDIAAHLRDLFLLELNAEETEILRNCCILPTSNVPLEPLLAEVLSEEGLCRLMGKKDSEKEFKKCLRRLARLHWLVEKDGGYRCHPVIAETAKAQLLPNALNCGELIKKVTSLLAPDKETNEPPIKRAPYGPLAEAVFKGVWNEMGDFMEEDGEVARLAVWMDNLFGSSGEIFKSLDYSQKAVSIREKILPQEHLDLAESYNNLAVTYGALGEHQKRLVFNQKALSIGERVLPAEHPDLAQSYNNLAATYHALGDFQKCVEYFEKSLSIREKVLPQEHPDLAQSYNNLATTYHALGDFQKCVEYLEKSLSIFEKVLPPEHPNLAASYNNLAVTYRTLGEHQKSLEFSKKALSIREKVLPQEHPDLASSYNNLAWTYQALGDLSQAVDYMRRAVAIVEKSLPAAHPHVAMAKKSLASLEEQLGR